ncbi:hypothetical protein [Streptomyces genisteinicus]|uniref:VCBS repeat-containing protein n=1 Tax=Streptomyces genisteinicus TaxID=2768068 RepID=A0A7H0I4S7_9ACTN|nr:hypothetical protein [Streptomyces genisteinicus]QNP67793.1 hypothetical protein IAG43_32810 [Streptomyces genisteinicus]
MNAFAAMSRPVPLEATDVSRAILSPRIRLAAAVLTVSTATAVAGTLLTAPGAAAAPAGIVRQETARDAVPFPKDAELVSAGRTGFLARTGEAFFWTGYDGTVTQLPGTGYSGADGADTVVHATGNDTYTLRDMGTDAEPLVVTTPGALRGVIGTTLLMARADGLHLVDGKGGEAVSRAVTGLPAGATGVESVDAGSFTVLHGDDTLYLVDAAKAAAVTHAVTHNSILGFESVVSSPTHLGWGDYNSADTERHFHLRDVRTGVTESLNATGSGPVLSPEWLAYSGNSATDPAARPLTLRSLEDGRVLQVLDRATAIRVDADGAFVVRGTLAREDGVYRVTVGADGTPAVQLLASAGRIPDLAVTREVTPRTADFGGPSDRVRMAWELSQPASARLTLTHTATGRQRVMDSYSSGTAHEFSWSSGNSLYEMADYAGEYTWTMTAKERYAVGAPVERTGSLTVNRPPVHRDHDANGHDDVLVRDSAGQLSAYEGKQLSYGGPHTEPDSTVLGTGWNTYTLMAAPGDLGGTAADDVVGRDRDGVLWLHRGEAQKLLPRTRIGGGWQVYNKITGGSDLNGDGRGDLLATDTSGVLWAYFSTGDAARPFEPRRKVGGGWQVYNLLTAAGNLAGAPGGDLLARDTSGVLWLYLGKGDGTFTARRKVGGGWQRFTHIAPLREQNVNEWRFGRTGLFAIGPDGSRYYPNRGHVDGVFAPPVDLAPKTGSTFTTAF